MKELHKTGKKIVVIVTSGRPLILNWASENVDAILQAWVLGTETGNAVSEVLFGDYNPSGKLPVTFPRHVGQIPIYYNHKITGRPYNGNYDENPKDRTYISKYRDVKNTPLYPFGYGLSYTKFKYSNMKLSKSNNRRHRHINSKHRSN